MSHLEILTENRLLGKRNAVTVNFGHLLGVPRTSKPTEKKAPRSKLQKVFLKRVQEVMELRSIKNPTQLSKLMGAPSQTTLSDILVKGADPRLETVNAIADALDVPAISLLTEQNLGNIHAFPSVPTISGRIDKAVAHKARDRNKGRG